MIKHHIGDEAFKSGLHKYLKTVSNVQGKIETLVEKICCKHLLQKFVAKICCKICTWPFFTRFLGEKLIFF